MPDLTFSEHAYTLRLGRFDHPNPRGLIARSAVGEGCVFLGLRSDGAVNVLELTIDGRTPREPALLTAQTAAPSRSHATALARGRSSMMFCTRLTL